MSEPCGDAGFRVAVKSDILVVDDDTGEHPLENGEVMNI
jgi:hypothetical protein